jgi:hypothetical protein
MIHLILVLALVGFMVYAIETWIPMPQPFKIAIYVIVAICLIWWLWGLFGMTDIPLPGMRR